MVFVGRKKEIKKIEESYKSRKNEFFAVYGRRRVGKTFLLKRVLEDKLDFYYTGVYRQTKASQLEKFRMTLNRYGYKRERPFKSWFEAFDALKGYLLSLEKQVVCVFVDELPWMDSKNGNFVQAIADFWNTWDSFNLGHVLLKFYICGSGTTWMIKKIIKDKGGLHNRLTDSIHLKPFTIGECEEYFKKVLSINYSKMEVVDIYMTVGGIPYYLSKFDKKLPVSVQVDNLFFSEDAILKDEFSYLYESLFDNSKDYKKIVELLCSKYKGLTRDEIIGATNIEGGFLTDCLENLEKCDFIRKYTSPKNVKRDSIYQITDMYTIFYLKFVENSTADKNYWTNNIQSPLVNSWRGFAFERIMLLHMDNIKEALGISGISTNTYSWNNKHINGDKKITYQIDMIIDRSDGVMNICELKYSGKKYTITNDYGKYINERIELFRSDIKTKKTLKNTFITSFGTVSDSANLPDISLTIDDIFN